MYGLSDVCELPRRDSYRENVSVGLIMPNNSPSCSVFHLYSYSLYGARVTMHERPENVLLMLACVAHFGKWARLQY